MNKPYESQIAHSILSVLVFLFLTSFQLVASSVSGRVYDVHGKPIAGASVYIVESRTGTS
jgi:protocatechuate 3,4-dioxygenase beta subunit